MYIHIYIHIHIYVCIYIYIYIHIYICIRIYTNMVDFCKFAPTSLVAWAYVNAQTQTCLNMFDVRLYIYVYIYIYMYKCI